MRWKHKETKRYDPIEGMQRIRKKFLFSPTTIKSETRWLEFATVLEEYICWGFDEPHFEWCVIKFIDEGDKENE
jgi:hypothetical protein